MTPKQAAALWNNLIWSDFGKAFECVIGTDIGCYRIQYSSVGNTIEGLESAAASLDEFAKAFREYVELEKQKPVEEPKPKRQKKTKQEQYQLTDWPEEYDLR